MKYTQPFKVRQLHDRVLEVNYNIAADDSVGILLTSDHHWDNPECVRKLLRRDHEKALETGAQIICIGDLFCAMQGKYDKRGSKSDIRPDDNYSDYLNRLVMNAADFYEKYWGQYIMVSDGNHETGVKKRTEADLLKFLARELYHRTESNVFVNRYNGWILLKFWRKDPRKTPEKVIRIWYTHGYGGGGPVTKGVIQSNRRQVYQPDADIILSGHIHEQWAITVPRERLNSNDMPVFDSCHHVQLPTYKEEYRKGKGFHAERGGPPKPLGGVLMEVGLEYHGKKPVYIPRFTPTFDMSLFHLYVNDV